MQRRCDSAQLFGAASQHLLPWTSLHLHLTAQHCVGKRLETLKNAR